MTSEAIATMQLARTRERVAAELATAHHDRTMAMKLVGECAALDVRPIIICDGQVFYTRELDIPENLKQFTVDCSRAVAVLERELYLVTR